MSRPREAPPGVWLHRQRLISSIRQRRTLCLVRLRFVVLVCFLLSVLGCSQQAPQKVPQKAAENVPAKATEDTSATKRERSTQRIVSMAPSITETLFALGCGDRVVGVTDFCRHPPQVRALPKVGGYINPNLEAVLRLQPDLVVAPAGQEAFPDKLRQLGLRVLVVDHRSLEGVFDSLVVLGRELQVEDAARELADSWRKRLAQLDQRWQGRPRPGVLMVVERPLDGQRLRDICAVGPDGFLDRLIAIAGGENVLHDAVVPFPLVSAESVLRLDPDIIIEIAGGLEERQLDPAIVLSAWDVLKELKAVREKRIYLLGDDVPLVPGPRMVDLAERLARCFHPEDFANE